MYYMVLLQKLQSIIVAKETYFTPKMTKLRSLSILVRLNLAFPEFCINFVSLPAKITTPQHQSVFLSIVPLNNMLSFSNGTIFSLTKPSFITSLPSNRDKLLFGGSHLMWPLNWDNSFSLSPMALVTSSHCRVFRLVSLQQKNVGS